MSVQVVGVKRDGTRVPAMEKQIEQCFAMPPAEPVLSTGERSRLFSDVVEPSLQRELRQRGAANGQGSYSAELIGYVEIC